jgi:hypothetical protein
MKNFFKNSTAFIMVIIAALVIGAGLYALMMGVASVIRADDKDNAPTIRDELMQLYSFNYVETSNPTKRVQLEAAIRRIQSNYKCSPSAMPDLKVRCKQSIPESEREIIKRLISLLEHP